MKGGSAVMLNAWFCSVLDKEANTIVLVLWTIATEVIHHMEQVMPRGQLGEMISLVRFAPCRNRSLIMQKSLRRTALCSFASTDVYHYAANSLF